MPDEPEQTPKSKAKADDYVGKPVPFPVPPGTTGINLGGVDYDVDPETNKVTGKS